MDKANPQLDHNPQEKALFGAARILGDDRYACAVLGPLDDPVELQVFTKRPSKATPGGSPIAEILARFTISDVTTAHTAEAIANYLRDAVRERVDEVRWTEEEWAEMRRKREADDAALRQSESGASS